MCDRMLGVFVAVVVAIGGLAPPAAAQDPAPELAGPLTLGQVLDLAEARSETVAIARAAVQRAEGEHVRARSGRLPQLTASASYDRALASEFSSVFGSRSGGPPCPPFSLDPSATLDERVSEIERAIDCGAIGSSFLGGDGEDVDLPFGRKNTWRVNLLFSQSVYSGGRLEALADIADAGRSSAALALESARAQLLFDVTQAFYGAALSERLVEIAEATVAQAEATVSQVRSGFEAGALPEFELLRATVTRDNQRPAVIRQRAARDIAVLRLKQLLDLPPDHELRLVAGLDGDVPPPPAFAQRIDAALVAAAAAGDAPVRTAVGEVQTLVRLREASLRAALAERKPSVSLSSSYGRVAYPSKFFPTGDFRTNWTVGAAVDLPILTGGRLRGTEMVARAELEQSRRQLQQVRELAQLDTQSALAELAAAAAALEASAGTVDQAARAYQITEVRFKAGVSTQLELADARLLRQQAEANHAQAARDLQVARARLALLPNLPLGGASGAAAGASVSAGSQITVPASAATARSAGGER